MALSCTIAASKSTPGLNQQITLSVTISNSGGSAVTVSSVTPLVSPIGGALMSAPALPLAAISVPASGTAVVTYTAVMQASGTYTFNAACITSDGSDFSAASPASVTVAAYSTSAQASFNYFNTAGADTVAAGPTSGNPAVPSFRALVAADLPTTINPLIVQLTNVQVADKASGGSIGSAATTVDIASLISVSQTTASQALTLPTPTVATPRAVYVLNNGSATFTMLSQSVTTTTGLMAIFNGTSWVYVA